MREYFARSRPNQSFSPDIVSARKVNPVVKRTDEELGLSFSRSPSVGGSRSVPARGIYPLLLRSYRNGG